MLGLALVQERFIANPRVGVVLPPVPCDFAPTSDLAVPKPAVTISLHVAWPVAGVVTLADFAGHVASGGSFPELAFAHEAGFRHFAIMFFVLGALSVSHLIDAEAMFIVLPSLRRQFTTAIEIRRNGQIIILSRHPGALAVAVQQRFLGAVIDPLEIAALATLGAAHTIFLFFRYFGL